MKRKATFNKTIRQNHSNQGTTQEGIMVTTIREDLSVGNVTTAGKKAISSSNIGPGSII